MLPMLDGNERPDCESGGSGSNPQGSTNLKRASMEKARFVHESDLEPNGCEWPKCKCPVPSYALSMHNRVHYCIKLTEAIESGSLEARQDPI